MNKKFVFFIGVFLILFIVKIWLSKKQPILISSPIAELISEVYYQCLNGRQIKAAYFKGPTNKLNSVTLALSDGRHLNLPQTISASGIRYAEPEEKIVFWSKGETAFITEGDVTTYADCSERIWTLGNNQKDKVVLDFLLSQPKLSWKTNEDSHNFCIFQNLAPENELFPHYLWVRCGEFIMVEDKLKELSGTSVPVKVDYPNELSFYDINKFTISIPRDGSLYDQDIKQIFPSDMWNRLHFESGPLNEKLLHQAQSNIK